MLWHEGLYANGEHFSYPVFDHVDVYWLKRCVDNAERWASGKMWDDEDHAAYVHVREWAHVLEHHLFTAHPTQKEGD